MWNEVANLIASGKAVSAWALSTGGIAEGVCKMALGNKVGFKMDDSFPSDALYLKNFGGILIEAASELPAYWLVGYTTDDEKITVAGESVTLDETNAFEGKLESVFPTKAAASDEHLTKVSFTERNAAARSRAQSLPLSRCSRAPTASTTPPVRSRMQAARLRLSLSATPRMPSVRAQSSSKLHPQGADGYPAGRLLWR
ncbi:MAG: hypothetical protein ACLSGI_12385 [Butyricicoccaceae bacterium]